MASEIRTVVTFESSSFNMSDPKDYFINPCCFGDDVGRWLIGELRRNGVEADEEPGQEDFGWYVNFRSGALTHTFLIGHRPAGESEKGTWIAWLERSRGLIGSLAGRRKHGIDATAAEAIHRALSGSTLVQDIRWHFRDDFDTGHEERAASSPLSPRS